MNIDANFPGGNIAVERINGDDVWLHQDLRDTEGWWFYWLFRVSGAAGRELCFHFTNKNVLTAAGPSISSDGLHWRWLGPEAVDGDSVRVRFRSDIDAAWLTYSIPYLELHLRAFLETRRSPHLRVSPLTTSEGGRVVEKLVVRDPAASPRARILLTARHHACESVANYVLEGILDFALDPAARFLGSAEILAIPFIDKDGVEQGDQGKNRRPHDHNRDYTDAPIYATVRALMNELDSWADERLAIALDLHCPSLSSARDVHIFFVEPPESHLAEFKRFAALLAQMPSGPLRYDGKADIPCGVEWNLAQDPTFTKHVREHTPARVAASLEFPYGAAGGQPVTADGAREFGRALALAMHRYLADAVS